MKLIVTGALGHIGSRLIRTVPEGRFSEVVLIDDMSTQRYCSLFDLPGGTPTRFVEADICTVAVDREIAAGDLVVHLAALTDATQSFALRERVEQVNMRGTERVALACAAAGASLVFPSTTSVYGTQASLVGEDCSEAELRPQSPYAESKLVGERFLTELGRMHGLRFVTLRLGTIFGTSPGMRFHTAINKFAWQACTGQPLTVWETARHQVRPYLHLDDAVQALWFIAAQNLFDQRIYNVVTTNASVDDIVTILRRLVPRVEMTLVASPIMNQLSYEVSTQRFRELGFRYAGTLDDGIARTVAQFRALLSPA
jgi:nucleoside-diphosphate-sugar epimerase